MLRLWVDGTVCANRFQRSTLSSGKVWVFVVALLLPLQLGLIPLQNKA